MKKFIVIILLCLVIVSLIAIAWHSTSKSLNDQKILEKHEIIEIFDKNKECFFNIKNSMSSFRYDWAICNNKNIGSGWQVCAIKDNLYLGIRRQEYFNQLNSMKKIAESEEGIKCVFKELGFTNIQYFNRSDFECIDFTKQASTGNVAGLLCCIRGTPETHPYGEEIVDLGEGWYYYGTVQQTISHNIEDMCQGDVCQGDGSVDTQAD